MCVLFEKEFLLLNKWFESPAYLSQVCFPLVECERDFFLLADSDYVSSRHLLFTSLLKCEKERRGNFVDKDLVTW